MIQRTRDRVEYLSRMQDKLLEGAAQHASTLSPRDLIRLMDEARENQDLKGAKLFIRKIEHGHRKHRPRSDRGQGRKKRSRARSTKVELF